MRYKSKLTNIIRRTITESQLLNGEESERLPDGPVKGGDDRYAAVSDRREMEEQGQGRKRARCKAECNKKASMIRFSSAAAKANWMRRCMMKCVGFPGWGVNESNVIRKTLKKELLKEQQGTPWCQACGQTYAMNNPQSHCHSNSSKPCHPNFDLNSVSCQLCKNFMQHPQSTTNQINNNIDQYCNQAGQPCHTSVNPWESPGKGWAQAPQNIQAKKGGGDTVKLRESELINIIKRTINESSLLVEGKLCMNDRDCHGEWGPNGTTCNGATGGRMGTCGPKPRGGSWNVGPSDDIHVQYPDYGIPGAGMSIDTGGGDHVCCPASYDINGDWVDCCDKTGSSRREMEEQGQGRQRALCKAECIQQTSTMRFASQSAKTTWVRQCIKRCMRQDSFGHGK